MQPGGQRDSGEGGGGGLSPAVLGMGWGAAPHTPHSSRDWTPWGHRAHGSSSVGYRGPSAPPAVGTRTPPQTPSELGIRTPTPPPTHTLSAVGPGPTGCMQTSHDRGQLVPIRAPLQPTSGSRGWAGGGGGNQEPLPLQPPPPPPPTPIPAAPSIGQAAVQPPTLLCASVSPPRPQTAEGPTLPHRPQFPPSPLGCPSLGGHSSPPTSPQHRSVNDGSAARMGRSRRFVGSFMAAD